MILMSQRISQEKPEKKNQDNHVPGVNTEETYAVCEYMNDK